MDFNAKIEELRAQKSALLAKAQSMADEGKLEEVDAIGEQMAGINNSIKSLERLAAEAGEEIKPVYDGALHAKPQGQPKDGKEQEARPFASLGEQLKAVYNLRRHGVQDKRLQQVNNAVLGSNEGTGADGGFAIQSDFAGLILESALERNSLLQRFDRYTVSANSNSMRWVAVDESDLSAGVFGGVQMYWAAEGGTVPATHPKLREIKLDLEKMMGFAY
ncbi:MAG TPA: phage major capsid protein, partial [Firmicutes bacterium]|nr:phage major capsid protein [Bacillota bacterium]